MCIWKWIFLNKVSELIATLEIISLNDPNLVNNSLKKISQFF